MNVLFWILWILDLGLSIITLVGKGFRRSFTASDPTAWFTFLPIGSLLGSLVLRFVFKRSIWSLFLIASPFLALLVWFILEKLLEKVA